MITIDLKTVNLLNEFILNGGNVISIGAFPALCNGNKDENLDTLKEKVICLKPERLILEKYLRKLKISDISISDNLGEISSIHYQQRDLGESQIFYMVNHDQKQTFHAKICLTGRVSVKKYNVEDSELKDFNYRVVDDNTELDLEFLPMQSHVIIVNNVYDEPQNVTINKEIGVLLNNEWNIEEADLNTLTLDYCSYSIDNGEWLGPVHTIKLMDILLKNRENCNVALKFNFEVEINLNSNREMYMVLEAADKFQILVNGSTLQYTNIGWWKDSEFRKVDIKSLVVNGSNEIVLKRNFYQSQKVYDVLFGENVLESEKNKLTYDVELESIYILGDFGVISKSEYTYGDRKAIYNNGPFVIVDQSEKAKTGDLTEQGFSFFAGSIKLSQQIVVPEVRNERIIVHIDKPNAIISKVYVNDLPVKILPWAPYFVNITDFSITGSNKLSIQLFAGNRNLLGPHHHVDGELYAVGPSSVTDKPGWESSRKEEQWRDRYCFVEFGL